MTNSVVVEGFIHEVRGAGRYTELEIANVGKTTQYFPVYTRERLGKESISKKVRVSGVLEAVSCMWRGIESKKVVVLADFLSLLED